MYPLIRKKDHLSVIQQNQVDRLEFLTFQGLSRIPELIHGFSTRMGGVSFGDLSSMNLSFERGDLNENVIENFNRIGAALGVHPQQMVYSKQTHTTNIRVVTKEDAGKGILTERDYDNIDGLLTDQPDICLVCSFADCVPLYFYDTKNKVIGLAHSGWKGTVNAIGREMVQKMTTLYGTDPKDIRAAIGPSICQDCYEVDEPVAQQFRALLERLDTDDLKHLLKDKGYYPHTQVLKAGKEEGKYQLDLWLANLLIMMDSRIPAEQIEVTDVCTCCNPEYLFSHRASHGKRGNLCAFLMRKE